MTDSKEQLQERDWVDRKRLLDRLQNLHNQCLPVTAPYNLVAPSDQARIDGYRRALSDIHKEVASYRNEWKQGEHD